MLLVHVPALMGHKIWGQFSKTPMCGSTCDILTPLYFRAFVGNVAYGNLWGGLERGKGCGALSGEGEALPKRVHVPFLPLYCVV